jgi:hypothetical protein
VPLAAGTSSAISKGVAGTYNSSKSSSSSSGGGLQLPPPLRMHTEDVCRGRSSRTRTSGEQQLEGEQGLHAAAGAAPQQSLPSSSAATCWSGFSSRLEQQYVQYKHQQYLWLDRYAAWYALLRFCVLLVRMVREGDLQGSFLYLCHVISKGVPYVLLLQSRTLEQYKR